LVYQYDSLKSYWIEDKKMCMAWTLQDASMFHMFRHDW